MTITALLDEIGYSYCEGEFRAEAKLPYVVWDRESESVYAGSVVVYKSEYAIIRLVRGKSDYNSESVVENVLDKYGIAYDKDDEWIGSAQRVRILTYTLSEGAVKFG